MDKDEMILWFRSPLADQKIIFFGTLCGMRDLSSPTRDRTPAPGRGSADS